MMTTYQKHGLNEGDIITFSTNRGIAYYRVGTITATTYTIIPLRWHQRLWYRIKQWLHSLRRPL